MTIKNLNIRSFNYGIWLYHSSDNSISNNDIRGCYTAIYVTDSSQNNQITDNYITNSYNRQIWLMYGCDGNTLSGNTVKGPGGYLGIQFSGASNNIVSGNDIVDNNGQGIGIYYSVGNTIVENNFINNGWVAGGHCRSPSKNWDSFLFDLTPKTSLVERL